MRIKELTVPLYPIPIKLILNEKCAHIKLASGIGMSGMVTAALTQTLISWEGRKFKHITMFSTKKLVSRLFEGFFLETFLGLMK